MVEGIAGLRKPLTPARSSVLLVRAAGLYDGPDDRLRASALPAGRRGFASGAEWMRLALQVIRGPGAAGELAPCVPSFHRLGLVKYGLAGSAALAWLVAALALGLPLLGLLAIAVFYAVEAQMVFLFPVALDGSPAPLRDARRWTVQAGGTLIVMRVVLPLAGVMLLGGFTGRGFVRCWCLGCLAVCLWYEDLRTSAPAGGQP